MGLAVPPSMCVVQDRNGRPMAVLRIPAKRFVRLTGHRDFDMSELAQKCFESSECDTIVVDTRGTCVHTLLHSMGNAIMSPFNCLRIEVHGDRTPNAQDVHDLACVLLRRCAAPSRVDLAVWVSQEMTPYLGDLDVRSAAWFMGTGEYNYDPTPTPV